MITYLRQLQSERDTLTQSATAITDQAARDERDVTDTERATLATMAERCAAIDGQLQTYGDQLEAQRRYAQLRTDLDGADREPERRLPAQTRQPQEPSSWGELFVQSAEFRSYGGRGSSAPVEVPGIFTRAPIDTGGIGGLPVPPYTANIPMPTFTTPLLDAVGHIGTNSNVVQWLVDDGTFPLAAVVGEGLAKPEANFTLDTDTASLQTYAHWKPITRQALSNIPMIQGIVESKLRGGIYAKLEADIGAALAAATIDGQEVDASTGGMLGAIRRAAGQVQAAGFPTFNDVLLNPADWAVLDLTVMQGSNGGPTGQQTFWGLRPIASPGCPVGTAYVGNLKQGVTVFDQGQASVFMSDSHQDYFIKNILVILAETMALPMVTQPSALVRVSDSTPDVP